MDEKSTAEEFSAELKPDNDFFMDGVQYYGMRFTYQNQIGEDVVIKRIQENTAIYDDQKISIGCSIYQMLN
ncbi:MAG: hypothetical protein HY587_07520, partial [Candidatus Omnitrophica bacterium]|nr:hypothetical protein [Candidatus Omnitrophota bacterium]